MKWASSDRIDDSISPDDSVAVEMTIDEVATSTAAEVDEIRGESVQPKPEPVVTVEPRRQEAVRPQLPVETTI